ncbi:MAG TPA: substrate-binding domain-containing protein, partial [Urbifossiella sp.]
WALASHPASGPWNSAASSMIRMGFESLSRRVSMKLDADQLALMPGITPADISQRARAAKGHGVRGVFLQPSRRDDEVKLDETLLACCRDERLPIVLLERNLRGPNRLLETDLVSADDLDGAARCTRHLLELGRKRIALVAGPITSGHDDRLAGYLLAIHSSQCCSRRKSVEHKAIVLGHGEEYPDRDSFAKLIEFIRKQGIDGLVCCADYTAVGLMVELLARGITVPGQVAVAGFDDLPIGNWLSIGVTTYAHPAEGIAEQAVRLMRDRIANPDQAAIKVVVPGRLIVRESTIGKG